MRSSEDMIADEQKHRQTDTLITILCSPIGGGVTSRTSCYQLYMTTRKIHFCIYIHCPENHIWALSTENQKICSVNYGSLQWHHLVAETKTQQKCMTTTLLLTHTHLTALFPALPRWAGTRKANPIWILLEQETVSGSGISWAIRKSAPSSRHITIASTHWRQSLLIDSTRKKAKHRYTSDTSTYDKFKCDNLSHLIITVINAPVFHPMFREWLLSPL